MLRISLIAVFALILVCSLSLAEDTTKVDKGKSDTTEVKGKATADSAKAEGKVAADSAKAQGDKKGDEWTTTESGLKYRDVVVGEGREATEGVKVESHYTLWLADGDKPGKKLQSSKDRGQTFAFVVGQPGLIKGWNEGMLGMKEGGTRQLIIPPAIGYGQQGRPPLVPGNATLFFEIDLVRILDEK